MRTIAILSQKGGTGKTTISLHLAVAAQQAGQAAVVIDLDPQASAAGWKDSRTSEVPVIVSAPPSRLPQALRAAESGGADIAIIDTAPHSGDVALAAAEAADLVLIPCRPGILDLRAIGSTARAVKLAGKPAYVVLNTIPPEHRTCWPMPARPSPCMASMSPLWPCSSAPPMPTRSPPGRPHRNTSGEGRRLRRSPASIAGFGA